MMDDYAILVGISKYADTSTFPELQGPVNDVELMKKWLTSPDGGGVSQSKIITIVSPQVIPTDKPDEIPPLTQDFLKAFKKVTCQNGDFIKNQGRLYLYFSGHGFCDKKSLTPQATLYAANATRNFPENIFGSYYALAAKDLALFREIVLIMDCCRDAEINRPPDIPTINLSGSNAAEDVKLLCIYAAPKGGKARERFIDGQYRSLLTHALLKAFAEAKPDPYGFVTSEGLKRHLRESWSSVCGNIPAPQPEIVLPTLDDIKFRSKNQQGILQVFKFSSPLTSSTIMEIFNGENQVVVQCDLQPSLSSSVSTVTINGSSSTYLQFDGEIFSLYLQPGYYEYVLSSGGVSRSSLFKVLIKGGENVSL